MQHDVVPSGPPVKTPPHRLSPEQAQWIDDTVNEEVARAQLVRGSSPWGSPAFPTREAGAHQKARKRRIVVDYRRVNARTVRAQYFRELIAEAAGSPFLSMVDAVTSFNQLQNSARFGCNYAVGAVLADMPDVWSSEWTRSLRVCHGSLVLEGLQ